jgi:hypothetical protein
MICIFEETKFKEKMNFEGTLIEGSTYPEWKGD